MSARILVAVAIASVAARADARCGSGDMAAVDHARAGVESACCAGAAAPSAYRACVKSALADLVSGNALPADCASQVRKCLFKAACGRPGYATCCRTSSKGTTRCRVRQPADCLAHGGCVGERPTCCDACGIGGCATTSSTTSSTTSTTTSSSSTSTSIPTPACGNGIVESGEMCDGQPECGADCKVHVPGCCSFSTMSCATGTPSLGLQAHFAFKGCWEVGGTATWGTACVPADPTSCPPGTLDVCGSCAPVPVQTMTLCCEGSPSCISETRTTGDGIFSFGESCLVEQGHVVLGTCGADGHCVPQP